MELPQVKAILSGYIAKRIKRKDYKWDVDSMSTVEFLVIDLPLKWMKGLFTGEKINHNNIYK